MKKRRTGSFLKRKRPSLARQGTFLLSKEDKLKIEQDKKSKNILSQLVKKMNPKTQPTIPAGFQPKKLKKFNPKKEYVHKVGINDLHFHCFKKDIAKVKELVENGADPCCVDHNNNTPLHICVIFNAVECLKYLLTQRDVDVMIKNRNGNTPLLEAICMEQNNDESIKLLAHPTQISVVSSDAKGITTGLSIKNIENKTVFDYNNKTLITELESYLETAKALQKLVTDTSVTLEALKSHSLLSSLSNLHIVARDEEKSPSKTDFEKFGINQHSLLYHATQVSENAEKVEFLCSKRVYFDPSLYMIASFEYIDVLKLYANKNKNERVVSELVETERFYLEDIKIINSLFADDVTGNGNENAFKKLFKHQEHRQEVTKFFKSLDKVGEENQRFFKILYALCSDKYGYSDQAKVIDALHQLEYKVYNVFMRFQTGIERFIYHKKKKKFKDFKNLLAEKQQLIPQPRIQKFEAIIAKPRIRLVKYKDLAERMLKYQIHSSNLQKIKFEKYVKKIKRVLTKINVNVGRYKTKLDLTELSKKFKKHYGVNFEEEAKSISKFPRYFIIEEKNVFTVDFLKEEIRKLDFFLFSDVLCIGDKKNKSFETIDFFARKVFFTLTPDTMRIQAYPNNCIADEIFDFQIKAIPGIIRKWEKTLKEHCEFHKCIEIEGQDKDWKDDPLRMKKIETRITIVSKIDELKKKNNFFREFKEKGKKDPEKDYLISKYQREEKRMNKELMSFEKRSNDLRQSLDKEYVSSSLVPETDDEYFTDGTM